MQDSVSLLPAIETCLHGNAKPARLVDVGSPLFYDALFNAGKLELVAKIKQLFLI